MILKLFRKYKRGKYRYSKLITKREVMLKLFIDGHFKIDDPKCIDTYRSNEECISKYIINERK